MLPDSLTEEEQEEIRNAVYGFTSELEYRTAALL